MIIGCIIQQTQTISFCIRQVPIWLSGAKRIIPGNSHKRLWFIRTIQDAHMLDYWLKYTESFQSGQAILSGSNASPSLFTYAVRKSSPTALYGRDGGASMGKTGPLVFKGILRGRSCRTCFANFITNLQIL